MTNPVSTSPDVDVELLHAPDAEVRQRRAAGALLARGCRHGDRVVFALGSSADLLCAVLGAARVGLIPVLLNATLTPAERDALADDAQPTVRIFDAASVAALSADDAQTDAVELAPHPLTRPMHYTSGTTGRPKGVTTGLWDEATAELVYEDEETVWGFDPSDLHMVCSPMYHTVSIRFSTNTLLAGGSLAILRRFDAGTALDTLRRLRPTTAFLVPTHLQRLLQHPGLGDDEMFDSLRLLVHAGAPCPESLKRATMARARPGVVWEFYGSTEAQYTVCSPDDWLAHPGTVGRARPGRRLSIAPIDGDLIDEVDEVDVDEVDVGTIWCDQPPFARFRYWRNPDATAQAWRGSACSVGDLGRLDPDGFLYLTGRRHDLIISGGVNVYPAEVENVLAAVPGVREVAVFGLPDEQWGQRVCVAYVPDHDAHADPGAVEDALRVAASNRLAPYKRPKSYIAAPDLPHTATGKMMRRAVPEHLGLSEGPGG
ncbi:MAG TPA: AMP-binding protein [Acidimicrobiales bacterium]|jgi:acyl-CoA synthetase (AMP-forming)/AMP-acid ligase II|nr:AMP-binding protein [Acidimicrobiales bacterium]